MFFLARLFYEKLMTSHDKREPSFISKARLNKTTPNNQKTHRWSMMQHPYVIQTGLGFSFLRTELANNCTRFHLRSIYALVSKVRKVPLQKCDVKLCQTRGKSQRKLNLNRPDRDLLEIFWPLHNFIGPPVSRLLSIRKVATLISTEKSNHKHLLEIPQKTF